MSNCQKIFSPIDLNQNDIFSFRKNDLSDQWIDETGAQKSLDFTNCLEKIEQFNDFFIDQAGNLLVAEYLNRKINEINIRHFELKQSLQSNITKSSLEANRLVFKKSAQIFLEALASRCVLVDTYFKLKGFPYFKFQLLVNIIGLDVVLIDFLAQLFVIVNKYNQYYSIKKKSELNTKQK